MTFLGFHVYPPPNTPPEPAPPDHPYGLGLASGRIDSSRTALMSASQTSLDEITCKLNFFKLFFRKGKRKRK